MAISFRSALYGLMGVIGVSWLAPMRQSSNKKEGIRDEKDTRVDAFTVLAANPVFAQQGNKQDGMKQGGMMGHDSGMGMMNGEQMQERMQRMHEKMNQARETRDPENVVKSCRNT